MLQKKDNSYTYWLETTHTHTHQKKKRKERKKTGILQVQCPIRLFTHSGPELYEFRTLPQGLWERFETEIKHFQGPKDIVLFNCVFWDNATSSTGWKVGVMGGHLECYDPITSPHQERWGLVIPSPTGRNKSFPKWTNPCSEFLTWRGKNNSTTKVIFLRVNFSLYGPSSSPTASAEDSGSWPV